jgi:predicted choloylglycine hydrolase
MNIYTRREFLEYSLAYAAGAALLPYAALASQAVTREGVLEVPPDGYPIITVKGSHREIGRHIGSAMRDLVAGYLEISPEYCESVDYLDGAGRATVEKMLAHAHAAFPHLVEEVEGMAEALDMPFERLFAFQCRSEIGVLKDQPAGCSTIALHSDDTMILAHNEDGDDLNVGRMFLVKATPPSGVTFVSFVYPGLIPGNGPGFNDAGLVQSTNYIQPRRVADGIPRYFIGRAILEAKDLEEAIGLATMTPRAFPYHHNLASLRERRILSVEAAAYPEQKHSVKEIDGLYVHTNHFLHPGMNDTDEAGEPKYDVPYESSTTRMAVLSKAIEENGPPASTDEIVRLLSLHEGRPYSPCRHPEGDVHGITLGTAVFAAPATSMALFHGNPCRGFRRDYTL